MTGYFGLVDKSDVENVLKEVGYYDLEFNGEYGHQEDRKFLNYIGYLDDVYEIEIQVKSSNELIIYDRLLDEKHYVPSAKATRDDNNDSWSVEMF